MSTLLPPKLIQLVPLKQTRLDELLVKNSEGGTTEAEERELTTLVTEAEELMVENAQRLVAYAKREGTAVPADAIPVTVWVMPGHAEQ